MIKLWHKIKEIVAILAFLSAAVTFVWTSLEKKEREELTRAKYETEMGELKKAMKEFEKFQENQITINAVEEKQMEIIKEILF